jgi:cation:H+ antiporter
MVYFILLAGLLALGVGGDLLVRGAVGISHRLRIMPLLVGLTIVSLCTSAPELVVSMDGALAGASGLALGNIVGSNIANVLVVLGLPALFTTITAAHDGIRQSFLFMVVVSLTLVGLSLDGTIGRIDSGIFLALLAFFLIYSVWTGASDNARSASHDEARSTQRGLGVLLVFVVIGAAGLALGGRLATDSAIEIARRWHVADSAIGLTILALGTSLPELAAGVAAASRGQHAVAIGNVLGSNILNILFILGVVGLIEPLRVAPNFLAVDYWVMLAAAAALVPIVFFGRTIGRASGAAMTAAYIVYALFVYQLSAPPGVGG